MTAAGDAGAPAADLRYHTATDLSVRNNSHTLAIELIGHDREVLDIGCSTGFVGAALALRGCRVTGIEADPAAAAEARKVLEEVVVANVEEIDLVERFGAASFDAVLMGDVLEHLRDPLATLRQASRLLRPDGVVVASLPNVAHGAVRLALLSGRFEYRRCGLLDDTHLRFFTRESMERLFEDAGLVILDVERTRLELFQTEIDLDPTAFTPELIREVERADEALTYQFVVCAAPDQAGGSGRALGREREQRVELARLRAEVAQLAELVLPAGGDGACRFGLWGRFDAATLEGTLRPRVIRHEILRRKPDAHVRLLLSSGGPGALELDEPPEVVGELSVERCGELLREMDCLLLADDPVASAPALRAGETPAGALAATDLDELPDPLVLLARSVPAHSLADRVGWLRAEALYPSSGPIVVVGGDQSLAGSAGEVAAALAILEEARGPLSVVAVSVDPAAGSDDFADALEDALSGRLHRLPARGSHTDVLAAVCEADAVVGGPGPLVAAAVAYGRPVAVMGWADADPSQMRRRVGGAATHAASPDELARVLSAVLDGPPPPATLLEELGGALDEHFDAVVALGLERAARRRAAAFGRPLHLSAAQLGAYVAQLEEAFRARGRRLVEDRAAAAARLEADRGRLERAERRAGELEAEAAALAARAAELEHAFGSTSAEVTGLQLAVLSARVGLGLPIARRVVRRLLRAVLARFAARA